METTDKDIFDHATAKEVPEQPENIPEAPTEAPVEAKEGRARDERGRYASATPEPTSQEAPVAPEPETQPEREESARVPSWRLAEEAERRRGAEQQLNDLKSEISQMRAMMLQQQQRPQEPVEEPDIFADPQGFIQRERAERAREMNELRKEISLERAHMRHGEKFEKAYDAFQEHVKRTQDQQSYQRITSSSNPGEELVKWHREQELHTQLGNSDLPAFLESKKQEWMKDPQFQAAVIEAFKATQNAAPSNTPTNLPPSLSKAAAARSSHDDAISTGADFYKYATGR